MNNRIEEILQLREQDPGDPFLWYVLALEYVKNQDSINAGNTFDVLLNRFPEYLPTYYQAANFFWEQGSAGKAKNIFIMGIGLAEKTGDIKIMLELKNSYQNFLIDTDD